MAVFDELKSIADVLRKADKIPEFQIILDIQQKLLDLQQENAKLKEDNKILKSLEKFERSLVYENNAYYFVNDDGTKEGPYCPVCWGGDGKKIRMRDLDNDYFYCDRCKASGGG